MFVTTGIVTGTEIQREDKNKFEKLEKEVVTIVYYEKLWKTRKEDKVSLQKSDLSSGVVYV